MELKAEPDSRDLGPTMTGRCVRLRADLSTCVGVPMTASSVKSASATNAWTAALLSLWSDCSALYTERFRRQSESAIWCAVSTSRRLSRHRRMGRASGMILGKVDQGAANGCRSSRSQRRRWSDLNPRTVHPIAAASRSAARGTPNAISALRHSAFNALASHAIAAAILGSRQSLSLGGMLGTGNHVVHTGMAFHSAGPAGKRTGTSRPLSASACGEPGYVQPGGLSSGYSNHHGRSRSYHVARARPSTTKSHLTVKTTHSRIRPRRTFI